MPVAGLGGKTRHGGADEIRQTLRLLRVACRDVAADHVFRSRVDDPGSFTRVRVVAADALQHEATGGCGIGGVAASGFFQHGCKAFGDGAVGPQEVGERDGVGVGVAAQNARVEAGLIAKGGVEAGWVDAERFGDIRNADGVIAVSVEQTLGGGDRLVGIEAAGAAAGTRTICSHQYENPLNGRFRPII